jgi:hypothetical protein
MNKGLTWITLRQGLEEPGCPICNILADGTRRNFSYFLDEGVLDPEIRLRLTESNGWCPHHTLLLLTAEHQEHPDHLGSATVYESLLEAVRRRLDEARRRFGRSAPEHSVRRRRRELLEIASALVAPRHCPACESEEQREDAEAGFFVETLFDPELGAEFRQLYEKSEGLCYRHLVGCVQRCTSPEQAAELLDLERPKWRLLVPEVVDYARKHEHRYHQEPFGNEIDAWARAARKLAGHRPPGTSLERLIALTRKREAR